MNRKRILKAVPVMVSGIVMILVGIAGFHHSFLAYGRIEWLQFVGYMIAAFCCVIVGGGLLVQIPSILKYLGGSE